MTPLQIAHFRAHAKLASYRRKVDQMMALIADIDPSVSYVSFSAGKDSSVIAHACHATHPGITMLMTDPGCPTHWEEHERDRWLSYAEENQWNLKLFAWDKWGLGLETEKISEYQDKIHADMFKQLHGYASDNGLTNRIMGLRAAESRNRMMLIGRRGSKYDYKDGGSATLPISTWQTADVWAYIITHGLPWLDIYDVLGPNARNGLIGRSGEEFGRIEYLKHYFPDVWRWAILKNIL